MSETVDIANERRHVGHGKWSMKGVPHTGWVCVDMEDLGEPDEICEMCETAEIRYVHVMKNVGWPDELRVGCVCAANMEANSEVAKLREQRFKSAAKRYRSDLSEVAKMGNQWPKEAQRKIEEAERRVALNMSRALAVKEELEKKKVWEEQSRRRLEIMVKEQEEAWEKEREELKKAEEAARTWIDAADVMLGNGGLRDYEEKFVRQIRGSFVENARFRISDKQINWFKNLYLRQQRDGWEQKKEMVK